MTALPAVLLAILVKASLDGAKMVMFLAVDNVSKSWGDTRPVRVERSGELPKAAVRFIICAEALAVRAAIERSLQYIMMKKDFCFRN